MKKQKRKTLRVGSFEQLESRALLAYAALPQMMRDMDDDRGAADFSRGPQMQMRREFDSFGERGGARESFRGEYSPREQSGVAFQAPAYQSTVAVVIVPIFVITMPTSQITSQPSFSEPPNYSAPANSALSNNTPERGPESSFVSSLSSPASNSTSGISVPAPPPTFIDRSPSTLTPQRTSLSVLSNMALGLTSPQTADADENTDTTAPASSNQREDRKQLDEESQLTTRQSTSADAPQTQQSDNDELIELNSDDLRQRAKRKTARTNESRNDAPKIRELATHVDRLSLRQELPRMEPAATVEPVVEPISDDLIELLTNDQVEQSNNIGHPATPFAAAEHLHLEANLGYFQAIESPSAEPELPAAVAAAALPVRAAQ